MVSRLVTKVQPIIAGVRTPKSAYSRVISFMKQVTGGGAGVIGVSEIVGQSVWVQRIQVITVWTNYTDIPVCIFDLYTGLGGDTDLVDLTGWDLLMPIFVGKNTQQWVLTPEFNKYDWTLNRYYRGQSRRFGISVIIIGVGTAYVYVSIEVAEG